MEEKKQENQFSGMTREEIIAESRKQMMHSAVLALTALIVVIVAVYAWFVSNKNVTARVGLVSLGRQGFELASVGTAAGIGGTLSDELTAPEGENYTPAESTTENWTWTAGKQTIQWQMTGEANLGNFSDNGELTEGIRPGLKGKLTFYVIPRESGSMTLKFTLSIIPLKETETSWAELDDNEAALNLLRGHLLFAFPQKDENGDTVMTLANYQDGSFTMDLGEVQDGTEIPVTLDWFWPQTLKDAVSSELYGTTISEWMGSEPMWFFYNEGKDVQIDTVSSEDKTLNEYFNNADKYIGDSIDAIILRLNADKLS